MKRNWLWVVLALVLAGGLGAQEAGKARIFALNLFALPVDVQWGDDGAYQALGMFSRFAAKAADVPAGVPRTVLFRRAGQSAWSVAKGADGQPKLVALEAGAVYVLVVRPNGNGDLVPVSAPATPAPKVLFVNAARGPLASIDLGASAPGLAPGWTAFTDAPTGVKTLSWAWPTMPPGTDLYRATSAQPGQPGTTDLEPGRWFVAVVSGVNGEVFDITP